MYCGTTRGLATYIGTLLKISKPSLNILMLDAEYCHNIVVPYIAEDIDKVVLVSSPASVNCVYRVLQTVSTMGLDTLMILPTTVASLIRGKMNISSEKLEIIEIESTIYRVTVLQTFLRIALYIGGKHVARIHRIEKELELKNIVSELIEKYSHELSMYRDVKHVIVSKALTIVGEELIDRGVQVAIINEHFGLQKIETPLFLIYTSVEEHIVNEFVSNLVRIGVERSNIIHLRINVDPFTAPIYSMIIMYYIMSSKDKVNDKLKAPEYRSTMNVTTPVVPG
ncbi:MAG: hypothetical protein QXG46_06015 [Ignisphaera sp.]